MDHGPDYTRANGIPCRSSPACGTYRGSPAPWWQAIIRRLASGWPSSSRHGVGGRRESGQVLQFAHPGPDAQPASAVRDGLLHREVGQRLAGRKGSPELAEVGISVLRRHEVDPGVYHVGTVGAGDDG